MMTGTDPTPGYILADEEVPLEEEDEPEAGYPQFAKDNDLQRVLVVRDIQGIVENAKQQRPDVDANTLFDAFKYYFDNDAFVGPKKTPTR